MSQRPLFLPLSQSPPVSFNLSQRASILLLDKKLARTAKAILFLKITADGFDLGDKRNPIEANDLPEAERVVKAWFKGKLNDELRMTEGKGIV